MKRKYIVYGLLLGALLLLLGTSREATRQSVNRQGWREVVVRRRKAEILIRVRRGLCMVGFSLDVELLLSLLRPNSTGY